MKKTVCIAFSLAFLIFALAVPALAAGRESENNNTFDKADPIALNEPITGNLANGDDEDWYRVTLSAPGYISATLNHVISASTSTYWRIQIYLSDGISGVCGYDGIWYVAGNENLTTTNIGLDKGTYYVKISPYSRYNAVTTDYSLTVNYTASDAWETENNSSYETADQIAVNKEYSGTVSGGEDEDWYRFTLDSDGAVSVNFSHTILADSNSVWTMYLYRSNGTTGLNGDETFWHIVGGENLTTCSVGLEKGDYYVKVVPYSRYRVNASVYQFTVNFESSPAWEKESNGSYEKATDVPLNTDFYGSMCTGRDTDWYRFTLEKAGEVNFSFTHPISATSGTLWKIYLYGANGTTGIVGESSEADVPGSENHAFPPAYLAAGTYYFKIDTYSSYSYSAQKYTLRLGFSEAGDCETEPNGTFASATAIETGKEYLGSLLVGNDTDCYKFTLDKTGSVTVVFHRKNENPTYIQYAMYEKDGTTRVGSTKYWDGSEPKTSVGYETLAPGTYYITVSPGSRYQHAQEPYGIEVLPDHEHTPNGEWTVTSEPKCLTDGTRQCLCTVCGGICESTVPAVGHMLSEWEERRAPTCEYQGSRSRACRNCYYSESENIPALGHDYGEWTVTYKPTCFMTGLEESTCRRCGDSLMRFPDRLEHDYGEWTVTVEATCKATGVEKSVCANCSDYQVREIPSLKHEYGKPELVEGSIFDYPMVYRKKCVNCGYKSTFEENKYRWAAPVIIIGGILLLAAAVLITVLAVRKKKKASAAPRSFAQNVQPPVNPGAPDSGGVTCSCGGVNPPGAAFCVCCGKKLK